MSHWFVLKPLVSGTPSSQDPATAPSHGESMVADSHQVLEKVDIRIGQLQAQCGPGWLLSWSVQATGALGEGQSQLPYAYGIRISSPLPVMRGGTMFL